MKKAILIILAISIYSTILSFAIDTATSLKLFTSGANYQWHNKSYKGYNCIINYIDKDTKQTLITGFEDTVTQSCPNSLKIVEITRQEALQIVQTRLNDKNNLRIILPANDFL